MGLFRNILVFSFIAVLAWPLQLLAQARDTPPVICVDEAVPPGKTCDRLVVTKNGVAIPREGEKRQLKAPGVSGLPPPKDGASLSPVRMQTRENLK